MGIGYSFKVLFFFFYDSFRLIFVQTCFYGQIKLSGARLPAREVRCVAVTCWRHVSIFLNFSYHGEFAYFSQLN